MHAIVKLVFNYFHDFVLMEVRVCYGEVVVGGDTWAMWAYLK